MKIKIGLAVILFLLVFSFPCLAWPACRGNWIQVPAGTSNASGVVVSEGGQTFQCQKPFDSATPSSTNIANQHQAQGQQQNQQQTQGQGQKQSISDSGNSSSLSSSSSTSNAAGGSAEANGNGNSNGNGSNDTTITTTSVYKAPTIPVETAYAPTSMPTSPCIKSFGGGAQTEMAGISFGAGKVDEGCDIRETARSYFLAGAKLAGCKVLITSKRSKNAGVTLEDCLLVEPVAESEPIPAAAAPSFPITVNVPPQLAPIIQVQAPAPIQEPVRAAVSAPAVRKHKKVAPCPDDTKIKK